MLSISVLAPVPYFLPAYFQSLILRVHGDDLLGCYPKNMPHRLDIRTFCVRPTLLFLLSPNPECLCLAVSTEMAFSVTGDRGTF